MLCQILSIRVLNNQCLHIWIACQNNVTLSYLKKMIFKHRVVLLCTAPTFRTYILARKKHVEQLVGSTILYVIKYIFGRRAGDA